MVVAGGSFMAVAGGSFMLGAGRALAGFEPVLGEMISGIRGSMEA
jgi:hypothetical protein